MGNGLRYASEFPKSRAAGIAFGDAQPYLGMNEAKLETCRRRRLKRMPRASALGEVSLQCYNLNMTEQPGAGQERDQQNEEQFKQEMLRGVDPYYRTDPNFRGLIDENLAALICKPILTRHICPSEISFL